MLCLCFISGWILTTFDLSYLELAGTDLLGLIGEEGLKKIYFLFLPLIELADGGQKLGYSR